MGGGSVVVEKIATNLLKRGHEVFVITTSSGKSPQICTVNGVKTYRLPLNIYFLPEFHLKNPLEKVSWHLIDLFNISAYWKIKEILKKETPDIVHIHTYQGLSKLVFKTVKDIKIPLVFTAHDYSPICIRTNLLNKKENICKNQNLPCRLYNQIQKIFIDNKPDVVTAPSKFTLKKLESRGLFRDIKKIVLPNPIETRKKTTKKYYENIDILFVGSLSKHKGPQILIKAFKKLKEDNLKLHILGRGPDEDELRKLAEGDNGIMFHGFLSGDELMGMYQRANMTVLPSICYDNSPMVIYESLMNSTPVIASRIGGIPELIRDGYNGFLFEPGSVVELSRILKKISEDPSILKGLERNAYESSQKYSIEDHVKRLEEIYRGLL